MGLPLGGEDPTVHALAWAATYRRCHDMESTAPVHVDIPITLRPFVDAARLAAGGVVLANPGEGWL